MRAPRRNVSGHWPGARSPRSPVPPNSKLALPELTIPHFALPPWSTSINWGGANRKILKRRKRKSTLMKKRSRTKPGKQINLRDAKRQKGCIKELNGEEVMGRENTESLSQNDWIANVVYRPSPSVHDAIFSAHLLSTCPGAGRCCCLYFKDTQRLMPRPAKGLKRGKALRHHSSRPSSWHAHCRRHECPIAQIGRAIPPKTSSCLLRPRAVPMSFHPVLSSPWLWI